LPVLHMQSSCEQKRFHPLIRNNRRVRSISPQYLTHHRLSILCFNMHCSPCILTFVIHSSSTLAQNLRRSIMSISHCIQ
jgi:hypothetical protein